MFHVHFIEIAVSVFLFLFFFFVLTVVTHFCRWIGAGLSISSIYMMFIRRSGELNTILILYKEINTHHTSKNDFAIYSLICKKIKLFAFFI